MIRGRLTLRDTSTVWQLADTAVVGRAPDVDVPLNFDAVSRRHVEIRFSSGRAELVELGSRNGTAVNGQVVESGQAVPLATNDVIAIAGVVELVFTDPLATPAAPRIGRLVGVWIDPDSNDVWVDAARVDPPLSARQLHLLKVLDAAGGSVVSRFDLIAQVWADAASEGVTDDSVTALVKRLRARLNETSPSNDLIEIVRGHGIRLNRPGDAIVPSERQARR